MHTLIFFTLLSNLGFFIGIIAMLFKIMITVNSIKVYLMMFHTHTHTHTHIELI